MKVLVEYDENYEPKGFYPIDILEYKNLPENYITIEIDHSSLLEPKVGIMRDKDGNIKQFNYIHFHREKLGDLYNAFRHPLGGIMYPYYVNKNLNQIKEKIELSTFFIGNKTGKKYVCQNTDKSRQQLNCHFLDDLVYLGKTYGWQVESKLTAAQKVIYLTLKASKKLLRGYNPDWLKQKYGGKT
ncbi:MAG: hypothetical protein QXJ93_00985 [Candidatus Rehaiarchaeum fermentans]|nr:hypothetical protein [Candidatus Rehaiarchaeum fermentans]